MKKIFHKIASLLMAFVVLLSTMSFTVDMHYCGDTLVETAVFHKATGCGMEMQKPSSKDCEIIKKNCCKDEQLVLNGQEELQLKVHTISFDEQLFIASFIFSYQQLFKGFDKNISFYKNYKVPLVIRQLYKLDETYLI
ncbi:MAG: hypothetical protein ACJA1B_003026 [Polaribacter sp.]|jgi:hypothetical protein